MQILPHAAKHMRHRRDALLHGGTRQLTQDRGQKRRGFDIAAVFALIACGKTQKRLELRGDGTVSAGGADWGAVCLFKVCFVIGGSCRAAKMHPQNVPATGVRAGIVVLRRLTVDPEETSRRKQIACTAIFQHSRAAKRELDQIRIKTFSVRIVILTRDKMPCFLQIQQIALGKCAC